MEQLAETIAKDSAGRHNPRRVLARRIGAKLDPSGLHSKPFRASRGIRLCLVHPSEARTSSLHALRARWWFSLRKPTRNSLLLRRARWDRRSFFVVCRLVEPGGTDDRFLSSVGLSQNGEARQATQGD